MRTNISYNNGSLLIIFTGESPSNNNPVVKDIKGATVNLDAYNRIVSVTVFALDDLSSGIDVTPINKVHLDGTITPV